MIQHFHSYLYVSKGKTYVHTKTWKQVFLAALFIIAKNWKQPACPPMDKETKQFSTNKCSIPIQWNTTQQ